MLRRTIVNILGLLPHKTPTIKLSTQLSVLPEINITSPMTPLLKLKLMAAAPNKEAMTQYVRGNKIPIPLGSLARQVLLYHPKRSELPLATKIIATYLRGAESDLERNYSNNSSSLIPTSDEKNSNTSKKYFSDINKLIWLTDIHLNFLDLSERRKFYKSINETNSEAILITGDIAEANNVCEILTEFSGHVDKTIYFVLGNHDYYKNSIATVQQAITDLCIEHPQLCWLGNSDGIKLSNDTILIGQDGWADGRYGNYAESQSVISDSTYIAELFQARLFGRNHLKRQMEKLADSDALQLKKAVDSAVKKSPKNIIIATHIPPFPECCWDKDKPSNESGLPFFSSKATGKVLYAIAVEYPNINFITLCGHTHTSTVVNVLPNLVIKTGHAEYGQPTAQAIIEMDKLMGDWSSCNGSTLIKGTC